MLQCIFSKNMALAVTTTCNTMALDDGDVCGGGVAFGSKGTVIVMTGCASTGNLAKHGGVASSFSNITMSDCANAGNVAMDITSGGTGGSGGVIFGHVRSIITLTSSSTKTLCAVAVSDVTNSFYA